MVANDKANKFHAKARSCKNKSLLRFVSFASLRAKNLEDPALCPIATSYGGK
jgi:hypothetical protein